jgi:hypothetical protein
MIGDCHRRSPTGINVLPLAPKYSHLASTYSHWHQRSLRPIRALVSCRASACIVRSGMEEGMAKTTGRSSNVTENPEIVDTGGELLDDYTHIDLVMVAGSGEPQLLYWTPETTTTAREIRHQGRLYRPGKLDPSFQKAMLLPSAPADYGDLPVLFQRICDHFQSYFDLDLFQAQLSGTWAFTTWVADQMPSPPRLSVFGSNSELANDYFRLMRCFCRRALILGDPPSFRKLPMLYRPTLLNQGHPSPRMIDLLRSSNHQGVFISGSGSALIDAVCSKALFVGDNGLWTLRWIPGSIPIHLPLTCSRLHQLNPRILGAIANEFQPYLFMYRLRYAARVRDGAAASAVDVNVGHSVLACFPDQPDLTRATLPLLESLKEDSQAQSCDEVVDAILEVLWTKLHEGVPEIAVAHIAKLTNALLRERGGQREYSKEELGWKLKNLQIPRPRRRKGKVVQFSPELSRHLHLLVRTMRVDVSARSETCADCKASQILLSKPLV